MYQFTEKFDTLLPRPGSGKRILKSKLLISLGATGVLRPYPQNTERLIERKILLQNAFNTTGGGGGGPTPPPPTCAQGVTDAAAWSARVVFNGGAAVSAATQAAVATFICGCITDGFYNKFLTLNVIAPDSLIAAFTPLIVGPHGSDPWFNEGANFVGADLSVNGLTGNALNKTLVPGLRLSDFSPQNTGGFAYYCYNTNNNGIDLGTYDEVTGIFGTASLGGLIRSCNGTTASNNITPATSGNGYYSDVRTGATDHRAFFANSLNPHAQIGATDVTNWSGTFSLFGSFQIFCLQDSLGSEQLFCSDTLSFVCFTQGFTATDSANLFTRVQALRVAFGGGFR